MADDLDAQDRLRTGQRVKDARKSLGWTKAHAARFAGVSTITWSRVEAGQTVWDSKLTQVLDAVGLGGSVQPVGDSAAYVTARGHETDDRDAWADPDVYDLVQAARRLSDLAEQRYGPQSVEGPE